MPTIKAKPATAKNPVPAANISHMPVATTKAAKPKILIIEHSRVS